MWGVQIHSFAYRCDCPSNTAWKDYCFLIWHPCWKSTGHKCEGFSLRISIPFYSYASVTCIDYCSSFVLSVSPVMWFFFLKVVLVFLVPLHSHMTFRISSSISIGGTDSNCFEFVDQFQENCYLCSRPLLTWDVFPFIYIFHFFYQYFVVLSIKCLL